MNYYGGNNNHTGNNRHFAQSLDVAKEVIKSPVHVLTYNNIMLRHINAKKLYMSILFRTFAIEKVTRSRTNNNERYELHRQFQDLPGQHQGL